VVSSRRFVLRVMIVDGVVDLYVLVGCGNGKCFWFSVVEFG